MRAFTLSILLIFSSLTFAESSIQWQVIRSDKDGGLWKDKKKKAYVAISSSAQRAGPPQKIDQLIEKRKDMLSYSGISKWKISKKNISKNQFIFSGEYEDGKGRLNYFLEVHHYSGKKVTQYLMTSIHKFETDEAQVDKMMELYE